MNIQQYLNELKSILFKFDSDSILRKTQLINELNSCVFKKNTEFKLYHQLLHGLMAYPSSQDMLILATESMRKLITQLKSHQSMQEKCIGTGFLNTRIECNFSYQMVKYLIAEFPGQVFIHSVSSQMDTQKAVLKLILPYVEYSKIHLGDVDFKKRLTYFCSQSEQTDLEWLVSHIDNCINDLNTRAFIFNQLGVFIHWQIRDESSSVSFLKGSNLPVYFHNQVNQKVVLSEILAKKLPKPLRLSDLEKKKIIDSARLTLCYLYRETEPFSNANPDDITLFQLEHGISIALFGSINSKRYSLESYIGYLVFKNNIPASYGGGWIFGERSQFGINILESFRGGESALIICELLRVYHQYFGANRFVVKPYQFGLHNPEAIKTGAFWFYYKLGFRPVDEGLKKLANSENEKKKINPKYKSEASTLRKYTKSNIELVLNDNAYPDYDSERLSQMITTFINTESNGNRQLALNTCFKKMCKNLGLPTSFFKSEDIEYAKQCAVLFSIKPMSDKWQVKNKNQIIKFITLKSAKTELAWIKHLQGFKAFWEYMQ